MKTSVKNALVICLALTLISFVGVPAAQSKLIPKITNFIIVVDQSGSMFKNHSQAKKKKATLAKEVLLKVNERIPELGYTGAIQVFAPDKTLVGPEVYNRTHFKTAIDQLPEEGEIFGNLTPLGAAIRYTAKSIPLFEGKTAIILVSDGIADITDDPLKAANEIYNNYENICFHAISIADRDKGRKTLRDICAVNNCAYTEGMDILDTEIKKEIETIHMQAREKILALKESAKQKVAGETQVVQEEIKKIEASAAKNIEKIENLAKTKTQQLTASTAKWASDLNASPE